MDKLELPQEALKQAASMLDFSPDEYRHHLEEFELTRAQENELLETLWQIMSMMVDIGWGVDNIHLMLPELFNQESDNDKNGLSQLIKKDVSDAK